MTYQLLDSIVLDRDVPEHGLRKGDLGAIVEVQAPDVFEVEFVTASGRTAALLTLNARDVRSVADDDLVSVRRAVAWLEIDGLTPQSSHPLARMLAVAQ